LEIDIGCLGADRMTMDRELALLLIGAAIALVSSIVLVIVQHLSLRADKIKRKRDNEQKEV